MSEPVVVVNEPMASGSLLLARDTVPITSDQGSRSYPIETTHVNDMAIDLVADKSCTVKVIRVPDGVTDGEASAAVAISEGIPTHLVYSQILCQMLRVVITNTSGANMTSMSLQIRGGA